MHDTAYLAVIYRKKARNYLGTSEGSVLNVHWSDGFGEFICLHMNEAFNTEVR